MKTWYKDGALKELLFLFVLAGLTACGSTASKYTAVATHTQQQVSSSMPTEVLTASDKNVTVTVRVMQAGEPNYLAKTGACYQLDVTVQSKVAETIEILGNDASVGGKRVAALCNLETLFDLPVGTINAMVAFATGDLTDEEERAKVMGQTALVKRILQASTSTQGFDYVPKDRVYEGFYFVYKVNGVEQGFHIPFTPPSASIATNAK